MPTTIPRGLLSAISATELVGYVCAGEKFEAVSLTLMTVEDYLDEAALLQRRMTRARRAIAGGLVDARMRGARPARRFPFRAVHFYANCWTIIGLHLRTIRDVSGFQTVGRALRPHIKLFERYTGIRDHYEHLNERLPGQRRAHRLRVRNDFGNLMGTMLTLGGDRTDVGPASMQTLRSIVREVIGAFRTAALEKLEFEQPRSFARLVHRAHTQRAVRRLQREWS